MFSARSSIRERLPARRHHDLTNAERGQARDPPSTGPVIRIRRAPPRRDSLEAILPGISVLQGTLDLRVVIVQVMSPEERAAAGDDLRWGE